MKKHLIAAAALATLSTAAFAQSVTLYGIIDQSIVKDNNAGTSTKQSKTSMESGAWLPSVYGLQGTEDLGGGLKASFTLEGNLNSDNGSQAGLQMFDRQSWVGVSGGFGEIRAGKQIDALFLQSFLNNVRLAHSNSAAVIGALMASTYNDVTTTAHDTFATADAGAGWGGTIFSPNTVSYTTPTFNGFKLTAQHMLGETAGGASKGNATGFLVNYSGIQGLNLSAGTKETNNSSGQKLMEQSLIGAVYTMGAFQLNAQNNQYKWKSGSYNGQKLSLNEFGAAYNVSPKLTAAINYVDISLEPSGSAKRTTDVTSVSLKYSLSKRTSLWTMASRVDKIKGFASGDTQVLAAPWYLGTGLGIGNGDATQTRTGYGVGITHTF